MPAGEDTIVSKGKASGGMKKPTSGNSRHDTLIVAQIIFLCPELKVYI